MFGNDLFAVRLELAGDSGPGKIGFDKRAAGVAKRTAPRRVAQQPDHRVGKIVGGIGGQEMASRFERQTFRADAS
jgi:hypothetical protein